jgi:N-acetylglutamate synthase-like GNAT family acetyltransferase
MTTIRQLTGPDIADADAILRAAHRVEISFERLLRINSQLTPAHWWLMEEDGRATGVVGSTDYGTFAHIGLMAIHPDTQTDGAGSQLLGHAIDHLEQAGFASITLYSTDAGLAFYPRHGFRWSGLSTEWQLRKRRAHTPAHRIRTATSLEDIARWDAPVFGGNRLPLLEALAIDSPGRTFIAQDESGAIRGFLVAQPVVIGPVAADSPEAAADLIHHALTLDYIDNPRVLLPEAHEQGEALMAACGFSPVRTSRYFIRGQAPAQQRDKMYGQTAYSLG